MELNSLQDQQYDIGKCAVFYADPVWDGTTNLFATGGPLTYLGAMMGEVRFAANPAYQELTLPEQLGPAALKRYITGTRPTATFRLFPSLDQMQVVSPTGVASLGQEMQRLVKSYTLWVVPESLFLKADANGFMIKVPVVLNAGTWQKDGQALTAEETRLLELSSLIWKADFTPLTPNYRFEEGGRSDVEVEVTAQTDLTKPEGCNQVLVLGEAMPGDAYATFTLDFEPV